MEIKESDNVFHIQFQEIIPVPKILLTEDNQDHALLVKKSLEQARENFHVEVALSASECFEHLSKASFDLVFIDYMLPDTSGLELMRRIGEIFSDLPVVMITGTGSEEVAVEAMKGGAYDYLVKHGEYWKTVPLIAHKALQEHQGKKERERLERELIKKTIALEQINEELEQLSITDELTKSFNYRFLRQRLHEEVARLHRYGGLFSFLLLDLDHFKSVNDRFGHQCGDYVLREVAAILLQSVREVDTVARYGGEEFGILLPEVSIKKAFSTGERIRQVLADAHFQYLGQDIRTTTSIGIAGCSGSDAVTVESLIQKADRALYKAKAAGRNRTVLFEEE